MKKFKKIAAVLLSIIILNLTFSTAYAAENVSEKSDSSTIPANAEYAEGEAIVCMKKQSTGKSGRKSASVGSFAKDIPDLEYEELMTVDGDIEAEEQQSSALYATAKQTSSRVSAAADSSDEKSIMLVKSDTMDTEQLIKTLEKNPNVEFAEPNYIQKAESLASDEPYYGSQWHLNNDGNHFESTGYDLNVNPVYDKVTTGSDKVVVAVIYTGVDYTHEDLADRMWDDGLKYSELKTLGGGKYGYCSAKYNSGEDYDTDDPYDDFGHGTHCAGIIGASWNNTGVAGISDNVEIMAVKAGNNENLFYSSSVIRGFNYVSAALDCGVNIKAINNSYGGGLLGSAIMYAVNQCGSKGALSFFGSGNDAYYDGTSMASPAAVGVAALLASAGIDDVFELKARIIGGVNRNDALSECTVSQGIIDAEKAYYNPEAVVDSIESKGDKITINGYFFGDSKGTVSMSGTELEVLQWSDNAVVCKTPDNSTSGTYEFRVTASDGRTGRKFLKFDGKDSVWRTLSTENITKSSNEVSYENFGAYFCDAGGDLYAVMTFLYDEELCFELYKYSIISDKWEKLLDFDRSINNIYSICGIDGNVYIICDVGDDEYSYTQLMCYDTKINKLSIINDDVLLHGMQCGTAYNGKILVVGGSTDDEDYNEEYAYEIDPSDGSVSVSDIVIPEYYGASQIKSCGDKLLYFNVPTDVTDGQYYGIHYYDGSSWTTLPDISNLSDILYEGYDFSFTDNGVIMAGHILDAESGDYTDVLEYDLSTGYWQENNNIYSTNDVLFLGGITYGDKYYVLSKIIGDSGEYEFKSLSINGIIIGDVNHDGVVNIDDVTYLQKYLAGYTNDGKMMIDESNSKEFMVTDFNSDGVINIDDVTEIQKYLAGYNV